MPIVAIAGAFIASAIAAPAIAGIGGLLAGGGLAAIDGIGGALEITAAVGATLGAVGAVTRDKGLQTAGMVIGGVGAVGSLANAAGLFTSGDGLFGSALGGTATAADATTAAGSALGVTPAAAPAAAAGASGIPDSVAVTPPIFGTGIGATPGDVVGLMGGGSIVPDSATSQAALQGLQSPLGTFPDAAAAPAVPSANLSVPSDAVPAPSVAQPSQNTVAGGSGALNNTNINPASVPVTAPVSPATPPSSGSGLSSAIPDSVNVTPRVTPSLLSRFGDWISSDTSGLAQYGMIQAGGSLVQGMFNPLTTPQIGVLNAQAAANRASAAISQQQAQNMAGPLPVAKLAPVSGAPQGSGLINSPVTGTVAPQTGIPAYG